MSNQIDEIVEPKKTFLSQKLFHPFQLFQAELSNDKSIIDAVMVIRAFTHPQIPNDPT